MYRIEVDLSDFRQAMRANKAAVPKFLKHILRALGFKVESVAKQQLFPGHGKVSGHLRRSIRPDFSGRFSVFIGPHTHYAGKIEDLYHYMEIGQRETSRSARSIGRRLARQYFGR